MYARFFEWALPLQEGHRSRAQHKGFKVSAMECTSVRRAPINRQRLRDLNTFTKRVMRKIPGLKTPLEEL